MAIYSDGSSREHVQAVGSDPILFWRRFENFDPDVSQRAVVCIEELVEELPFHGFGVFFETENRHGDLAGPPASSILLRCQEFLDVLQELVQIGSIVVVEAIRVLFHESDGPFDGGNELSEEVRIALFDREVVER